MRIEKRLEELGIQLPELAPVGGNFLRGVITGNLLYLSGQGPKGADGVLSTGKVGDTVSLEKAYADARLTAVNQLAVMKLLLGDLDRVVRVVKVLGMVNAAPDFTQHPKVINGFSDLLQEVFGDAGRHARSAVGMGSLPGGMTVEVEMIVEIRDEANG